MNNGISVIVFIDGGMRIKRAATEEDHCAAVQSEDPNDIFTHIYSRAGDPPSVVLEIVELAEGGDMGNTCPEGHKCPMCELILRIEDRDSEIEYLKNSIQRYKEINQ